MTNAIDDILKPVNEVFLEKLIQRISSPFILGFALSWVGWNFMFVVIILSSNTVSNTISLISKYAFPDLTTTLLHGFVYPLVSAIFYTFAYPFIHGWIYRFTIWRQVSDHNAGKRLLTEVVYSGEQVRLYEERNAQLITELRKVNSDNSRLDDRVRSLEKELEVKKRKLSKDEIEILGELAQHLDQCDRKQIGERISSPEDRNYAIGELISDRLIEEIVNTANGSRKLIITQEGRRKLVALQKEPLA